MFIIIIFLIPRFIQKHSPFNLFLIFGELGGVGVEYRISSTLSCWNERKHVSDYIKGLCKCFISVRKMRLGRMLFLKVTVRSF